MDIISTAAIVLINLLMAASFAMVFVVDWQAKKRWFCLGLSFLTFQGSWWVNHYNWSFLLFVSFFALLVTSVTLPEKSC